jgi:urease subunit alpha
VRLTRDEYAARYGPTAGDRIRLADTCLWVRVEADHAVPGDEAMWGYGKNLRSRMSQYDAATTESELDMVVLGVVVIEPPARRGQGRHRYQGWADRRRRARR